MIKVYTFFLLLVFSTAVFAQLTIKNSGGDVVMQVDDQANVTIGSATQTGALTTHTLTITGGATAGAVLKSNASGLASWGTDQVDDDDADPTNEFQTLSLSGTTLQISDGNSVTLPTGSDNQQLGISGHTLSLERGGSVTLPDNVNDADHVIGNEFPLPGNSITVSGDRTVNHADNSSQSSVNNSGRTVIQDVTLDAYGHVTGLNSSTLADNVNDADHDLTNELQTWNEVIDEGNILTGARNPVLNNRPSAGETHVSGILHFGDTTTGFNINRQTWGGDEKLVIGAKSGYVEFVTTPSGQPETQARICIQANGILRIRGMSDPCHTGDGEIDPKIYIRFETP
jgi:hypothetical protein